VLSFFFELRAYYGLRPFALFQSTLLIKKNSIYLAKPG